MKEKVLDFIQAASFPCIMAKAVARKGYLETHVAEGLTDPRVISEIRMRLYSFIDQFRKNPKQLSSFILILTGPKLEKFEQFEEAFFLFLKTLNAQDKALYPPDPRVSSNVSDPHFS